MFGHANASIPACHGLSDVKATGDWTRALYKQDCENLVIDVDGFYSSAQAVLPLEHAGYQRVVFFAGGSGVTAFLAFVQVS